MKAKLSPQNLVVITLAVALLVMLAYMRSWPDPSVPDAVGPPGIAFGPVNAAVTVVAFLSPVCSHCETFERVSAPTLYEAAEAGTLRYVVYPVKTGRTTDQDMAGLICAAHQNAFPKFLKVRYGDPRHTLKLATALQLDARVFERCLKQPATAERSALIGTWAKKLKVQATPTFYINDRADAQFRKVQGDKGVGFWEDVKAFAGRLRDLQEPVLVNTSGR